MSRITSGTFHYGLARVMPQAVGFLLIPLYAALLTPHDYGLVDMYNLLFVVLAIVSRLGLGGSVARFYFDFKEGPELRNYLSTMGWCMAANSLLVAAVLLATAPLWLDALIPGFPYFPFFVMAVLVSVINTGPEIQNWLLQSREQSALSAKLNGSFAAAGIVLALFFVAGLRWGAFGMAFAQFLAALLFSIQSIHYLRQDFSGGFKREYVKNSLVFAGAQLPAHLLAAFSPMMNRSILAHSGSLESVGLIALANRFSQPVVLAADSLAMAYPPIYYRVRTENQPGDTRQLVTAERTIWFLTVSAAAFVAMAGPPALRVLTPSAYHEAAAVIPVLVLVPVMNVVFTLFGSELYFSKKTWILTAAQTVCILVNSGITWALVGFMGPLAAATGMAAGQAVFAIITAAAAYQFAQVEHDWFSIWRTSLVMAGVSCIPLVLPPLPDLLSIPLWTMLLAGAIGGLHLLGDPTPGLLFRRAARSTGFLRGAP
ncbi:MAG: hypothetical protein GMKNLPBB_03113 [Myxococcota bacterium]|nr:hypothetical protein [Myxococcota bacterium]